MPLICSCQLLPVVPQLSCPVALFTSCNPILKLGIDKFMSTVKDNGVHGLVVPDVPIEETTLMRDVALKKNIELVLLTTPAPARERMKTIECILGNHGAPDYVKMVERLSNSIGDFERMPPGWLGSPALLVQCPTLPFKSVMLGFGNIAPQLKTPKAYIGGSVPMEIDTTDQEQRDYLFYGRCYIKGKPCSVVMDTGSTTNLIAESLCNYLKLGLMDHPKPYMLGGICGTGIPVSRQAWVPFTLGDYGDTKLFDVAPTPAVDVLFGLRWMREMKVIYDGYANVYHIQKDGRTITLYPLTPLEIDQLLNDIKESRAQNES